jgi:hypothetical protein
VGLVRHQALRTDDHLKSAVVQRRQSDFAADAAAILFHKVCIHRRVGRRAHWHAQHGRGRCQYERVAQISDTAHWSPQNQMPCVPRAAYNVNLRSEAVLSANDIWGNAELLSAGHGRALTTSNGGPIYVVRPEFLSLAKRLSRPCVLSCRGRLRVTSSATDPLTRTALFKVVLRVGAYARVL